MSFTTISPKDLALVTGATFAGFLYGSAAHMRGLAKNSKERDVADQIESAACACEASSDDASVKAALALMTELARSDGSLAVSVTVCQHMSDAFDAMSRKDRKGANASVTLAMDAAWEVGEPTSLSDDEIAGALAQFEIESGTSVH